MKYSIGNYVSSRTFKSYKTYKLLATFRITRFPLDIHFQRLTYRSSRQKIDAEFVNFESDNIEQTPQVIKQPLAKRICRHDSVQGEDHSLFKLYQRGC